PGVSVVPDYVLQRRETHRWVLSFEIKRTNEAVRSTRYQIQAKGYAETNQDKYDSQSPKYFAISNLETTVLCALNGTRPPNECRLQGGFYSSGMFATDDTNTHRNQFIADLRALVARVMSDEKPVFDVVWPAVLTTFRTFSAGLPNVPEIYIEEPAT